MPFYLKSRNYKHPHPYRRRGGKKGTWGFRTKAEVDAAVLSLGGYVVNLDDEADRIAEKNDSMRHWPPIWGN